MKRISVRATREQNRLSTVPLIIVCDAAFFVEVASITLHNDRNLIPPEKSKLPTPNVQYRASGSTTDLSDEEIRGILVNPMNVGIGPFPRMVSDEQLVVAAVKSIETDGSVQFFVNLLFMLREAVAGKHLEE